MAMLSESVLPQEGLIGFGVMCLFSGLVGGFLKKNYYFSKEHVIKELCLFFKLSTNKFPINEFSGITIREEVPKTQGADLSRQANKSYKSHCYVLSLDRTALSKGKRVNLKKYFDKEEVDKSAIKISEITRLRVNRHYL